MRDVKTRVAIATMASLALVGGCSSSDEPRSARPTKSAVRTIDLTTATPLKLGDDLPVMAELPSKQGAREVLFDGFADDNTLFGVMGLPEPKHDVIPGAIKSRSYPFLYDLPTKKFSVLDESSRQAPPFVADMAATPDAVVWLEGTGVAVDVGEFEIRSFDRGTGNVTALGRFGESDGQVAYGNDLVIHDDIAYFSTRVTRKTDERPAVYAVPVDGSHELKVLVPDAEAIQLEGDSLSYDRGDVRQRLDLSTGNTAVAPASRFAADPGFCGAGATRNAEYWCVGRHVDNLDDIDDPHVADPVLTFNDASGRMTTVATPAGAVDENFPVPADIQDYGDWIGVTVSSGDWPAPQFLIDLGGSAARIMPTDTVLTEVSPEGAAALFSEVTADGDAPQRVVRLPKT